MGGYAKSSRFPPRFFVALKNMLAEIIIYIALFTSLFTGAFSVVFQIIDDVAYLEQKKDYLDSKYFMQVQIDYWLFSSTDWLALPDGRLQFYKNEGLGSNSYVMFVDSGVLSIRCQNCAQDFYRPISGKNINILNFKSQIVNNSAGFAQTLKISMDINSEKHEFCYYK